MTEAATRRLNNTEKCYYIIIVILLFHITRNINMYVYIGSLFASYMLLFIFYLSSHRYLSISTLVGMRLRPIDWIFMLSLLWIPAVSLVNMGRGDYLQAVPRFLVTFPFILFTVIYNRYSSLLIRKVLRALCVFIALAALSIPYQILFGPIQFFADFSYREGLIRYSSLAGSLTALGTLGGFSLAILLFTEDYLFNRATKRILIIITVLGMLTSLQKAAAANIIICFGIYVLLNVRFSLSKRLVSAVGLLILLLVIYSITGENTISLYIQNVVNYSFGNSSKGIVQDLITRIWERPYNVIQYHEMKFTDFIFGIGFPALAGTMGLSDFPMAHNNYFDLLFSGGILHFVSFLFLLAGIPLKILLKKIKGLEINVIDRSYSIVIIIFMINMLIGAASFYQPINVVFIFFIVFSYSRASTFINKGTVNQ